MKKPPSPIELLHKCTRKEQAFILLLVADPTMSHRDAYMKAGFTPSSPESADANASKCLRKDQVREALDALRQPVLAKAVEEAELTSERIIAEVARMAFVNVTGVFDEHGNIKPFTDWTPAQQASLQGFEVIIKNAQGGDGVTDTVHKIKMGDKLKALELGAKIRKMLVEKVEVEGNWDELAALLASARSEEA